MGRSVLKKNPEDIFEKIALFWREYFGTEKISYLYRPGLCRKANKGLFGLCNTKVIIRKIFCFLFGFSF